MASWAEFEAAAPELAETGKRLLYQFGVGLGFLATLRQDGGPRLHPVCPVIAADGLYVFAVPSPKRGDLRRDGRYALHSYPPVEADNEFCVTGRAAEGQDPGIRAEVAATLTTIRSKKNGLSLPSTSNGASTPSTVTEVTGRRPTPSGQILRSTRIETGRDSRWSRTTPRATAASAEAGSDTGLEVFFDTLAAGGHPGRGAEAPWQLSRAAAGRARRYAALEKAA